VYPGLGVGAGVGLLIGNVVGEGVAAPPSSIRPHPETAAIVAKRTQDTTPAFLNTRMDLPLNFRLLIFKDPISSV
jgi:hypothetical protein